jgi:hypothetical protein
VGTQVVEHDDVAGPQLRCEHPLDEAVKDRNVGRAFYDECRNDAFVTQCAEQRDVRSVVERRVGDDALAARRASVRTRHREIDAGSSSTIRSRGSSAHCSSANSARATTTSGRCCSLACVDFFARKTDLDERVAHRRVADGDARGRSETRAQLDKCRVGLRSDELTDDALARSIDLAARTTAVRFGLQITH